jgi:hypothetical protein
MEMLSYKNTLTAQPVHGRKSTVLGVSIMLLDASGEAATFGSVEKTRLKCRIRRQTFHPTFKDIYDFCLTYHPTFRPTFDFVLFLL